MFKNLFIKFTLYVIINYKVNEKVVMKMNKRAHNLKELFLKKLLNSCKKEVAINIITKLNETKK